MRTIIAAVILCLFPSALLSQSTKSKQVDMTVFGLHLGETFRVLECEREKSSEQIYADETGQPLEIGGVSSTYREPKSGFCFEWGVYEVPVGIKPDTPVVTYKVLILGADIRDADPYMDAWIVDRNLEGVTVHTHGLKYQDYWLAQLKKKYGEPTHLEEVHKENGFGAVFTVHKVAWRFTNLLIDFEGAGDSTDMGSIEIMTKKGIELLAGPRRGEHAEPQTHGPKL